jgi:glycosyltransferase involved in cell wall biosynthesis
MDYLNVDLAMVPIRFARIATYTPDGCWVEREKKFFLLHDIVQDLCSTYADVPCLFLLLLLAHFMRPFRWFKRRISRVLGSPARPQRIMYCIPSMGMGGAQRQMLKVIERTAARYEVSTCVLTGDDFFFKAACERSGATTHVLNEGSRSYLLSALRLCRLLRSERIDVLHSWLPMANVVGAIAGTLAGTPRIISSERCLSSSKQTWYPQWWFRFADALAARLCTVVTTNSHAVLQSYVRWAALSEKRAAVVYNGIDPNEFEHLDENRKKRLRTELGIRHGEAVVGIFGRLEAEKDHGTFLRAFRGPSSRAIKIKGLIVGGGSQEHYLRTVAGELGLADRVLFLGSRLDATSLMQICDVIVLTSLTEGMPNVLLEAQCLGIPVITTDAGGCREVVEHGQTGFVAPIGDSDLIAAYIETLLANSEMAGMFRAEAKRRIRTQFALDPMVSRFEALYTGHRSPTRLPVKRATAAVL